MLYNRLCYKTLLWKPTCKASKQIQWRWCIHPHTVLTISVPARHFISDEQEFQESRGKRQKKKVHRTLNYLLIWQPNTLIPFNYLQLASQAGKKLRIKITQVLTNWRGKQGKTVLPLQCARKTRTTSIQLLPQSAANFKAVILGNRDPLPLYKPLQLAVKWELFW